MSRIHTFAIACCLGLLAIAFLPARADQWNKKTILTVNEAIALPNAVLQPGKYVIKLQDSQSNRNIVQVFTEGEQKLVTTVIAIPNYRLTPADNTEFSFWETTGATQARPLRSWFYPGDNFGQEFAYPQDVAMRIARDTNQNVPAIVSSDTTDTSKAEVKTMTPSGQTEELAQNQQTSAGTQQSTATSQAEATTTTPAESSAQQSQPAAQPSAPAAAEPSSDTASTSQQSAAAEPSAASQSSSATATDQSAMTQPGSQTSSTAASQATQPQTDTSTGASSAQAETATTAAPAASDELPRTASPLPLIGLAGLVSAAAAMVARAGRR